MEREQQEDASEQDAPLREEDVTRADRLDDKVQEDELPAGDDDAA